MRVQDVTIQVRSLALGLIGEVDKAYINDLQVVKRFNNVGSWQFSLPTEYPMALELAQKGRGIKIKGPGWVVSGRLLNAVHKDDSDDPAGTLFFTGCDDNIHLADAVCYPDPAHEVDAQAFGHDIRTGNAETVMRAYVNYNIGPGALVSRQISAVTLATNLNRGDTIQVTTRFDVLGALLSDISTQGGGLGFELVQVGTNLEFQVYEPEDKSDAVRMSIQNDMLAKSEYGFGAPSATRAIVAGQGEDVDRKFLKITTAASLAEETAWGRKIEFFKDRRDTNDDAELTQEGTGIVETNGITQKSLSVEPADDIENQEFGVDWYLGDIVGVTVDNQPITAMVTEVIILMDQDGVRVGATLGNPTGFDYEAKMIANQKDQERRLSNVEKNVGSGGSNSGYIIGSVVAWPGTSAPPSSLNLLELNGQVVLAATYADLAAIHPEWVSGANMTLPDYGTRVMVGYKSGDADFGTNGALVGSKTHTNPLGLLGWAYVGIGQPGGANKAYIKEHPTPAVADFGDKALTGSAYTTGAISGTDQTLTQLGGTTEAGSSIQPGVVVKYYVCAASSLGTFDPAVQNALSVTVAANTGLLAIYTFERPVKTVITAQSNIVVDGLNNADYYKITYEFPTVSVANSPTFRLRKAAAPITTGYDMGFLYGYNDTAGEVGDENQANFRLVNGDRSGHHGFIELSSMNLATRTVIEARTTTISSANVIGTASSFGQCRDAASATGFELNFATGTVTGFIVIERRLYV